MRIDQFVTGAAADHVVDGLLLVDVDGSILDANPSALAEYGYSLADVIALTVDDLRAPSQRPDDDALADAVARGEYVEEIHKRGDGSVFPAEVRWTPITVDGESVSVVSVRDVSHRSQARMSRLPSESRLAAAFDNVDVGFVLTDAQGGDASMNAAALELFQFGSAEEMRRKAEAGESDWEMFYPDGRVIPQDARPLERAIQGDYVQDFFVHFRNTRTGTEWDGEVDAVPVSDEAGEITLIVQTVRDVTESRQIESTRQDMAAAIIDVVGNVSEMRDPYTAGHQRRVAEVASAIAVEMGLTETEIADIRIAGLMHDIGKMSVPAGILTKPSALSSIELNLVKEHSEAGYSMIAAAQMHEPIAELVYQHHERCDGSGYPRGLRDDQLLVGSKVLMVSDVVEAMMSHRSYRESLGQDAALAEIEQGAGRLYDPKVTEACLRIFREQGFAFTEA